MNNSKLIADLKNVGAKVHIAHFRLFDAPKDMKIAERVTKMNRVSSIQKRWNAKLSPHGGATVVEVITPSGEKIEEISRCRTNEQFQKSLGVSICLSRIIQKMNGEPKKSECTGECRTCECDSKATHNHD